MALLTSPRQPTRIRLEDYTVGGTTVAQMGTIVHSSNAYNLQTGEFSARLLVLVEPHALNPDGTVGRKFTEAPFQESVKELTGANDTLMSAATGQFLAVRRKADAGQPAEGDAEWWARVDAIVAAEQAEGRDCILQGDALENQRIGLGVAAEELKHLRAADQLLHRFAAPTA